MKKKEQSLRIPRLLQLIHGFSLGACKAMLEKVKEVTCCNKILVNNRQQHKRALNVIFGYDTMVEQKARKKTMACKGAI